MFNKDKLAKMLKEHRLFSHLTDESASLLCSDRRCSVITAENGCSIFRENRFSPALGLILKGNVLVYRKGEGLPVLLQRLETGKLFGVASLFSSENEYVTELKAEGDCEVFSIPASLVKELLEKESAFALDYIAFLSGKIRFLNKRISELSAPTVTQKLASYLLSEEDGIATTKVKLASALGIGRASLYRALDEFEEKGLISVDGKAICITDRKGLSKLI